MFLFVAALLVAQSKTPVNFKPRTETFDYIKREEMIPMHDGVRDGARAAASARFSLRATPRPGSGGTSCSPSSTTI